jgi:hypothetical protein
MKQIITKDVIFCTNFFKRQAVKLEVGKVKQIITWSKQA